MLNKKGFALLESVLLFMIICMLSIILSFSVQSYHQIKKKEVSIEVQEERIKAIYE